jgi:hypothetical protein
MIQFLNIAFHFLQIRIKTNPGSKGKAKLAFIKFQVVLLDRYRAHPSFVLKK